jgi:arylsulfatase A
MKNLTKVLLILLVSWMYISATIKTKAVKKPNIIFILADDLGYMDLGCYGNPFNETPNLDSLAKGGIRFTQAYSSSTVCSPSRAAIMTGKHPARLKITNFLVGDRTDPNSPVLPANWQKFLPSAEITLPERLKTFGYQTGMVGKWHLGDADTLAPWSQGFDYTRLIGKNGLDYYNYGIFEGSYKKIFTDNGKEYMTDKLTDYAVDFIEKKDVGKPFYLHLCYSAPHVLLVPKADKLRKYFLKYEKYKGKYNPDYATMIESMDEGIGRIMATLKQQNLLDNTLIIFASDNGGVGLPELGPIPTNSEPLRKWKGHVYEGGIRVPTIMYWKGEIEAQQTCYQYFMNTDYVPTILDILGQNPTISPDGMSILPLLKNPEKPFNRGAMYWHYPHFSNQMSRPAGAIRQGDWKLVESFETGELELFNLKEDIGETKNLLKEQPNKAQELTQLLKKWQLSVDANMPIRK